MFAIDGCTELTEALFDSKFTKRLIDPEKFKLGTESEPVAEPMEPESLWIDSASISANGVLSVEYGHRLATSPRKLRVEVRHQAIAPLLSISRSQTSTSGR